MNFALLLPLGLAALAALIVPLLLHLNRRQEQKPTPFAALRWVRGPARPRRRIRLEQWPLLLLRLLTVATLALLLAAPVRYGASTDAANVVAVIPGVDPAQARAAVATPAADWRWLQPGFPSLSTPAADASDSIASLLRELDTELPAATRLQVVAPPTLHGLDGGAIRLSREVDWHIVNSAPAPPPALPPPPLMRVSLRAAADAPGQRYLRAAIAAANRDGTERYRLANDAVDAPIADDTDVVFWLAGEPGGALLRWIDAGGTALVDAPPYERGEIIARDAQGAPLLRAEPHGRGRLLRFAAALGPATMPAVLDADFPFLLFSHLRTDTAPPDSGATAALRSSTGAERADTAPRPLTPPLAFLVALLVAAERILSLRATKAGA